MARRRGLANSERLALDIITVTATGAVVAAPCFVYSVDASLSNTNATGLFTIADTSAAADAVKESAKYVWTLGAGGASALADRLQHTFIPPFFVATQLFWANSTGIGNVSISYLAAS